MNKSPAFRNLRHRAEYFCVRLLSVVLTPLPDRFVYAVTRGLAWFAWNCMKIRRDVTMNNLRMALGREYSEAELNRMGLNAYFHIGMTFIEMLLVPKLKDRIADMVDTSDIKIMQRNTGKKRGIIVVSCHCGSWEMNGASLASSGIPCTGVVARQSNPYVDAFITRNRESLGMTFFPLNASAKHLVAALKNNQAIGLISDQDAGRKGAFVDFFGHPASTPKGTAQLALKYKAPVVVAVTVRTSPGRYKSIFQEVDYDETDTVETLTQRYTTVMEKIIRQYPEQYLWMHRRWKSKEKIMNK